VGSVPYEVWVPLAAVVVGYAGSLATEAYRGRRQSARDRERRADERSDVRALREQEILDRRTQFQRETLLELQEVVHQLGRTYGQEHHQDTMTARTAGKWDPRQLPERISDKNFEAQQRSSILVARVGDDLVRDAVQEMNEAGGRLTFAGSQAESDELMMRSLRAFDRANSRIGELLRDVL
jgi:hypothetical protein